MPELHENAAVVPPLVAWPRGDGQAESGYPVRAAEAQGVHRTGAPPPMPDDLARAAQTARGAGGHQLPAEPHPQASLPPGTPRFTQAVEVDAPTVDLIIKRHALELLKAQGFAISDGEFYVRAQVLRMDGGGVVVQVKR